MPAAGLVITARVANISPFQKRADGVCRRRRAVQNEHQGGRVTVAVKLAECGGGFGKVEAIQPFGDLISAKHPDPWVGGAGPPSVLRY